MQMPDITGLIILAYIGMAALAAIIIGGGGWLLYHLSKALIMYLGA